MPEKKSRRVSCVRVNAKLERKLERMRGEMVKIVMGPSCAGKSTYIKEHFPNSTVVDLYECQEKYQVMNYTNVIQSYIDAKEELVQAIKEGKDVVLEHTLLKSKRRPMYINAIKEVTDEPIVIYVLLPTAEQLDLNMYDRLGYHPGIDECRKILDFIDIPTTEEGFSDVVLVRYADCSTHILS